MPKRYHPPDDPSRPLNGHTSWSIGSNSLTSAGQSAVLKQLGERLQADYQSVLKEPPPDRLKQLLDKLEQHHYPQEPEDH